MSGIGFFAHDLASAVLQIIDTTVAKYSYGTGAAVAWLILGDEDRAMTELDRTVRLDGYRFGWGFLEIDPIFEPLWSREEFRVLVDYIRADMARQLEHLRMWEASEDRKLVLDFTD